MLANGLMHSRWCPNRACLQGSQSAELATGRAIHSSACAAPTHASMCLRKAAQLPQRGSHAHAAVSKESASDVSAHLLARPVLPSRHAADKRSVNAKQKHGSNVSGSSGAQSRQGTTGQQIDSYTAQAESSAGSNKHPSTAEDVALGRNGVSQIDSTSGVLKALRQAIHRGKKDVGYECYQVLKECNSIGKLQYLVTQFGAHMDIKNLGFSIDRIEKILKDDTAMQHQHPEQQPSADSIAPYQTTFEQLWQLLQKVLDQADSRLLCRILCVGSKVQHSNVQLYQKCLDLYLAGNMAEYGPRNISNVIYAVCTAPEGIREIFIPVTTKLLETFMQQLSQSNAQDISNLLYGLAGCGEVLEAVLVQQLIMQLLANLPEAKVQAIANSMWAVASMELNLRGDHIQQLVAALAKGLPWARALDVSHTVWACAKFGFLPAELLSSPRVVGIIKGAGAQEVSNIAWGIATLGYWSQPLVSAIVHRTRQLMQTGLRDPYGIVLSPQHMCNIIWSLAVLNQPKHAETVVLAAHACGRRWGDDVNGFEMRQLWQVHNWLLGWPHVRNGQGLRGVLSAEQMAQCKAEWDSAMGPSWASHSSGGQSAVSRLQQSVFDTLLKLRIDWMQPPLMEQRSADGSLLIDITARTAYGVLLAVEVDGPHHFRRPDGKPMGPTLYRNRALAVRGFSLVSIPVSEWSDVVDDTARQRQYLVRRLKEVGVELYAPKKGY